MSVWDTQHISKHPDECLPVFPRPADSVVAETSAAACESAPLSGNRSLLDYYRCPEEFACCVPSAAPSRRQGFFRPGSRAVRDGSAARDPAQTLPDAELHDALQNSVVQPGKVQLPFNPDDIVDSLRLERYRNDFRQASPLPARLAAGLYYAVRPLLGVRVRRHLQRLRLSRWRSISFPRWPVDTTVEQIHEALLRLCILATGAKKIPFIWFWPDRSSGCAMLTHDVETAQGRDFSLALAQIDADFGIKSSFQLVPEKRYKLTGSFLDTIRAKGCEVNVHDLNHDGKLFSSEAIFFDRVRRINGYGRSFEAEGFRSGALYRNPDWFNALQFSYDMSVPNVAHLDPQRGGCCTVTPYFVGNILELPVTTTQDYSLFHILGQYSTDLWRTQIEHVLARHGLLSFIIHPDYVIEKRAQSVYHALLAELAALRLQKGIWFALPREVNRWWRARSRMRLVRRGGSWIIEGPLKEKATVAYATLQDDCLKYEPA